MAQPFIAACDHTITEVFDAQRVRWSAHEDAAQVLYGAERSVSLALPIVTRLCQQQINLSVSIKRRYVDIYCSFAALVGGIALHRFAVSTLLSVRSPRARSTPSLEATEVVLAGDLAATISQEILTGSDIAADDFWRYLDIFTETHRSILESSLVTLGTEQSELARLLAAATESLSQQVELDCGVLEAHGTSRGVDEHTLLRRQFEHYLNQPL